MLAVSLVQNRSLPQKPSPLAIDPDTLGLLIPWGALVDAMRNAFCTPCDMPQRLNYTIPVHDGDAGSLLVMPAWQPGDVTGIKIVNVFPANARTGTRVLNGVYVLCSAVTGETLAIFDAEALTARRTAAVSALAATFLARADSTRLLIMGTGHLAPFMVEAHASVLPIRRVAVWGRNFKKAELLSRRLSVELRIDAEPVANLAAALETADIVCTATLAKHPILHGASVKPGTHVDLVGGFTREMREADDELIRCARVYVDKREAAACEAGDLVGPLSRGIITPDHILGDLSDLCTGEATGRNRSSDITLFKSVGLALEDLAAARLAFNRLKSRPRVEDRSTTAG
jgi:alanine dehydrogenase